jgi:hypothetical protein
VSEARDRRDRRRDLYLGAVDRARGRRLEMISQARRLRECEAQTRVFSAGDRQAQRTLQLAQRAEVRDEPLGDLVPLARFQVVASPLVRRTRPHPRRRLGDAHLGLTPRNARFAPGRQVRDTLGR